MVERIEKPRVLEYPFEYFDVQVQFAKRWSEITGEPLSQTLLERTAIYRRLIKKWSGQGQPVAQEWIELCKEVETNLERATSLIVRHYIKKPHSIYAPHIYPEGDGKHFNSFAFDYLEELKTVKVHYMGTARAARSGLAKEHLGERLHDLAVMFRFIKDKYPEAEEVIGGSWLYNLEAYRRIFPPTYTQNMLRLVPPQMHFMGDSTWGQFIDSLGRPKKELCIQFSNKVAAAQTMDDLINAFPFYTFQPSDGIQNFYKFLGID